MKLNLKRIESPFVFELSNQSGQTCTLDASEQIGGKGKGFRPMELVAGGLAACASIDVINILQKKRILLGCYEVDVRAERTEGSPAAFKNIHLAFVFYNVIDEGQLKSTIDLALYKYCSVAASLNGDIEITYSYEIKE